MAIGKNEAVNVVFSSDARFVPYFATSLFSVLYNYADDRPLHVYWLAAGDVTEDHVKLVKSMRWKRRFDLHVIRVDPAEFVKIKTTEGISPAAYNRLYMASILPKSVSRAIYLDSDIIVEKNIADIYDLDMSGLMFRGVEDSISVVYKDRYDLPPESHHINSGVMLCDISFMRSERAEGSIQRFLEAHQFRIVMGDQQIINEVFHAQIGALPLEWNVHGSMFDRKWRAGRIGNDNHFVLSEVESAVSAPAIIHYTFKRKPWMSLEHPRARTWHRYNEKTPFAVGLPPESPKANVTIVRAADKPKPSKPMKSDNPIVRLRAYLRSLMRLRLTRLQVASLDKRVAKLTSQVSESLTNQNGGKRLAIQPLSQVDMLAYRAREALLSQLLRENSMRVGSNPFVARDFVDSLPDHSSILCNAMQRDLDGGFNENLKTILRTANIGRGNMGDSGLALILVHRIHTPEFWHVINTSQFFGTRLMFAEMNFFGAFSTYFDKGSKPAERRCLGFILDDMGSYFDARQPSRIEHTLNDPTFNLSEDEVRRAKRVMRSIVRDRVTKYNKYVGPSRFYGDMEQDAVVVVDQKRGDASIEFARADDASFDRMLRAALDENPGKTVYLKAHPDNLHRGMSSQSPTTDPRVKVVNDDISAPDLLDRASKVYVVSSQMGFEALIRGKQVVCFGLPFYAGWGATDDRADLPRRKERRTVEEIFHVSCIRQSVYVDPKTGKLIEIEAMLKLIKGMRTRFLPQYSEEFAA